MSIKVVDFRIDPCGFPFDWSPWESQHEAQFDTTMAPLPVPGTESLSSQVVAAIIHSLQRTLRAAFITKSSEASWYEWLDAIEDMVERNKSLAHARVGLVLRPTEKAYALLLALSLLECDVFLLGAGMSDEEIEEMAASQGWDAVIDPSTMASRVEPRRRELSTGWSVSGRGDVTLFTSGSTGRPKPVRHDWRSLTRPVRRARSPLPQPWLLAYRPHLYAGLQVFLHCLINQETLVIPEPGISVDDLLDLMGRSEVRCVSATPSFWRRLIALGGVDHLKSLGLEQITLGGEVCDQPLLDALKRLYSPARLVHIYATSELGRCFSVKDGCAGFPASFLDAPSEDGVVLKIEDGELFVRSANAMLGTPATGEAGPGEGGWLATGDLVEQVGDRCFFVGRRNDVINVGGNKVQPLRVEQVLHLVPGVRDVRVFAQVVARRPTGRMRVRDRARLRSSGGSARDPGRLSRSSGRSRTAAVH